MRPVMSFRFVATLLALMVLAAVAYAVGRRDETLPQVAAATEPRVRRADLVSLVYSIEQQGFGVGADGLSVGQARLILDGQRSAVVYPGTPGEITCPQLDQVAGCGVLLELLGDAVVSFDLVPLKANPLFTVELPAVEGLEGGLATLTNGWQVPYAPVIDRSCDTDTDSFRDFLDQFENRHTAVFDLGDQQIIQVICTEE